MSDVSIVRTPFWFCGKLIIAWSCGGSEACNMPSIGVIAMQMHAMVTGWFVSRYGFGYPYETSTSLLKHNQTAHDGTF